MRRNGDVAGQVDGLLEMVRRARRVVTFTGAGISTECGIPDFRSPGGLWSSNMPIDFQSFVSSPQMRVEAWRRKFALHDVFDSARPGKAHQAVAHLIRIGKASSVITQNIDNLHQMSGVPQSSIIELHGNGSYAHCLDCGLRHEIEQVREIFEREGRPPDCRHCGGIIKTATISFGQPMPAEAMARAHAETIAADLFIAAGSSLVVYPAAGFPVIAKRNGAKLVIVNRESTELDELADLVIREDVGVVLQPLHGLNA